jgi:hypothetical protein
MILHSEEEARAWVAALPGVSRETMDRLDALAAFVADEAKHQNLVSHATLASMWQRHIADSAQLLRFARNSCALSAIRRPASFGSISAVVRDFRDWSLHCSHRVG